MQELKEINQSLEKLKIDFNKQIEIIGSGKTEFHNALIDLSSKYPEHKELLSFIVHINDKLETNQSLFIDVVSDTFNELIVNKNDLVKKIISDRINAEENSNKNNESIWDKTKEITSFFKNSKIILTAIAIISIAGAVIINPSGFLAVIKALASLL